jgi:hypothetical protein
MRVGPGTLIGFSQLVLASIGAAQAAPIASSPLIGTWEATNRSAGGLGSTIAFGPDNSLTFTIGAMVDMKYRLASDTLIITDPEGKYHPETFRLLGDTLVTLRDGRELRETRVGQAAPGGPLVGRWTYVHRSGVPAFEEFTRNGDFRLRVPIHTLQGNYTALGDSAMLHLPGPGGGDRGVRFAVTGDTLQLTWNGQTSRYLKAKPLGR